MCRLLVMFAELFLFLFFLVCLFYTISVVKSLEPRHKELGQTYDDQATRSKDIEFR